MKLSRNLKRIAMAGASVMLCAGAVLPSAIPALANTPVSYGDGYSTVENVEGNETTFKAFKIFNANVNEDGSLSNFQWASNTVRSKVLAVITDFNPAYSSFNAQDAADFISAAYRSVTNIWDSEMTVDETTILKNQELLNQIAAAVDDIGTFTEMTAGVSTRLAEGYWFAVTDSASIDMDETGTSPIYIIQSNGGMYTITEKTSVPTVDKQVLDDEFDHTFADALAQEWMYGADAERFQSTPHKITGTLAKNFATYGDPAGTKTYNGKYYYEFQDTMSVGISYDETVDWKVYIYDSASDAANNTGGHDVTRYFTRSFSNRDTSGNFTMNVKCEDLLSCGVALNADSRIVLTYNVYLNENCIVGAEGNPNDVKIIYSSNPNTNERDETHEVRNYLYTFELHMEKKDRDTNVSLAGAKFLIKVKEGDDQASTGLYVLKDGSLGTETEARRDPYVTDSTGCFGVDGLDLGTYTLIEIQAPTGYQWKTAETDFTIDATYNEDGTIKTLKNTVENNADGCAGIDSVADDSGDGNQVNLVKGDPGTGAIVEDCLVNVTVGNIKKVFLPVTGQNGIGWMMAAGGGVAGISVAGLLLSRRKRTKKQGNG